MSVTVPLYGFGGGGGAPLNFEVVGNQQPDNSKENTLWVNTDVKITSWIFSATEPENPAEGMVWFSVGTSSPVEFNALKKNGIQIYPLSAKQCRKSTVFRYIKLQMDELDGTGKTVQFSDIRFVDDNGGLFAYPSGTTVSASIEAVSTSENETKLIDNNADTKYCSTKWLPGSYILIDLGASGSIDLTKYKKWQWYTAQDSAEYTGRNLKTFSLWGSNDGNTFTLLDSAANHSTPSQNSAVAYSGKISSACVWNDVDAKIYRDGEWVPLWSGELYYKGKQYEDKTGGWGSATSEGSVTFESDSVKLATTGSINTGPRASIYTKKKVDLTPYKTLGVHYVDTVGRTPNYACQIIQVCDTLNVNTGWPFEGKSATQADSNTTKQDHYLFLDISNMNGSFYIGTTIDSNTAGSYGVIDKIWIE